MSSPPPLHSWHLHDGRHSNTSLLGLPTFSLTTPAAMASQPLLSSASSIPASGLSVSGSLSMPSAPGITYSHTDLVPPKLKKRILDLEYVDMAELVPDTWRLQEVDEGKCCHKTHHTPRRGPVKDILLWVECYATLVSVLTTQYADKAPSSWPTCGPLCMHKEPSLEKVGCLTMLVMEDRQLPPSH